MANGIVLNIDTTKSEFQNPMVQLRQGDGNYQSLAVTVTSNGEPFDLTGWTVTFMGTTAGGFKIIDTASVMTNALQGEFTYTPTKAWGQDQGEFKNAYFKFTKSEETASGASFRVNVLEAVDLTAEEAGDYISVVDALIDDVKTSMDEKLAETKKTLSDTQSQATTVQGNVNDLNNNVNDLKSQNNAIKTTDNTWSGTNTFNKRLIAQAGVQGNADSATNLQTPRKINGTNFDGTADINVNAANDSNLVHNTGNETVTGDKTFTGTTTFTKPIIGALKTKDVPFTDFNDVAKNMVKYSGTWNVGTQSIANSPLAYYYTVNVTPAISDGGSGYIELVPFTNSSASKYIAVVGSGVVSTWKSFAFNDSVVHNTGDESIGGNKSITGSLTINDANPLKVKQSATVEFDSWQSSKMKATRFGNIVSLRYSVDPNNNNAITKKQTSSVVIPQGYRPMEQWNMAVGGISTGSNVLVNPDGTLTSGWQDVQYAGMMTAMYFTADPFPS